MMPELFRRGFTRICMYCTLIFISAAACGQDTNFATAPQYLSADVGACDFYAELIVPQPAAGSRR
jgi:hypothetical protein